MRRAAATMFDPFIPKRRPQDAVKLGAHEPQEEDFALCAQGGQANLLAWAFPRNASFYDRFMTLSDLSPVERSHWQRCYQLFLKKLTYKYGRRLVLKSPSNTGKIKALLELFPSARFVHIHRHPFDIFRSHVHTLNTAGPYWQLQRFDYENEAAVHSQIIEVVKKLYRGYFAERSLIPAGRLHNVAYDDLERDPLGQIQGLYSALDLPTFQEVQQPLQTYIQSLSGYQRNSFAELPQELRTRLRREWHSYFEEWGYAA
jgi:hypothetical protein